MSHTQTYLPVRDFNTIRIVCRRQDCRAVIELPPSRVEEAMKKSKACCAFCGKPFTMPSAECGADVVTMLAKAVLALNTLAPNVGVEFPLVQ